MRLFRTHDRGTVYLVLGMLAASFMAASFMGVFSRWIDGNDVSVQFLRALFAVLSFGFVILVSRRGRFRFATLTTSAAWRSILVYAGTIILSSSTFLYAFRHTTMANTIVIHYLSPFIVFLAAPFFLGERSRACYLPLALLAAAGIILTVYPQIRMTLTRENLLGVLSAFVSAFGFAGIIMTTRRVRRLRLPLWETLFAAWLLVLLAVLPLFFITGRLHLDARTLFSGVMLGVLSTGVAYTFLNAGMIHLPAGPAAIVNYSEVVFTVALGALVFGETVTVNISGGGVLIFIAIALLTVTRSAADTG